MPLMTGLSGNEMYCLHLKGLTARRAGDRQQRLFDGLRRRASAPACNSLFGGEVTQITNIIHEGRQQSYGAHGARGPAARRARHHRRRPATAPHARQHRVPLGRLLRPRRGERRRTIPFSTSGDGQELYCQLDAGYTPMQFVFGNVAYSIGIGGGILGALKSLGRGEIKEFSDIFNATRHLALAAHRRGSPRRRAPTPWSASRPASCRSRASTKC